jgi:hypothetical protein
MNIIIGPLEAFYIVGAIVLLIAILLVYPTILERSKKRR